LKDVPRLVEKTHQWGRIASNKTFIDEGFAPNVDINFLQGEQSCDAPVRR
jgi:hypothetical protein